MKQAFSQLYSRFKSAPKFVRVSTYLILTYAGYAVILGLITPAVLESQAPKQLQQLLGRKVNLEKVSINPFLLRARVQGFSIEEKNEQTAFSQFDLLEVEINFWRSLLTLTPTVDHLTLTSPKLQVARLKGGEHASFNFSDILDSLANNSKSETSDQNSTAETDAKIPAFKVNQLQVSNGEFHFTDAVTKAKLGYTSVDLNLSNVDSQAYTLSLPASTGDQKQTLEKSANQYTLSLSGTDQSSLKLTGQFQLPDIEVNGELSLNKLGLTSYWPFAKDQIKAQLTDGRINFATHYHAKQIGDKFSYQANHGRFELTNLVFNDQKVEKVKLPSLVVDGIDVSGDRQSVNVADITMQGLWADAAFGKDGLDLATLFTPVASSSTPSKTSEKAATSQNKTSTEQTDAPAWQVHLDKFAMQDSDLNVQDNLESAGVHWRVYPMSVTTGAVQSDLAKPIDYTVAMDVSSSTKQQPQKSRGAITTSGKVDVQKLNVDGKLAIESLDLSQLQPYLKPYLNIQLTKGALSTQGDYKVNGPQDISFDGSTDIANLLIKDNVDREPLVKWKKMSIDSLRFNSKQNQLFINTVLLDTPYAKVMINKDKKTNIGDLVVTQESKTTDAKAQNSKPAQKAKVTTKDSDSHPMSVIVQQIKFEHGSAFFADNSLTPNFSSGIEFLEGSIKHLSSTPGTKASVDITGKVDKYAPVSLKGEINPLIENPYLQLALKFKSIELTSVNPYSGTYAGYYIDKGQLSLELNYQLDNNKLQGSNHVVVDQLKLGKPSDSTLATSLPITLAIAILQDRHGVIDLGVDVSGDVDDPSFSFGGVILKAFVNIVTKAVTAPFSLLANLVGTDDQLNEISFQPGMAVLEGEEKQRVAKLAKALDERPILKVSVEGSVALPDDSFALAEQQVQQQLLIQSELETLPEPFSASRIADSSPLVDALETLAEKQLQINLDDERAKVEKNLAEKSKGEKVTDEQINTTLYLGLYNQLVNATKVDKYALSNLAGARAKAIKEFLVDEQNISPDRVFLLDSKTDLHTQKSSAELTVSAE